MSRTGAEAMARKNAEEAAKREAMELISRAANADEIEDWKTLTYRPKGALVLVRLMVPGRTEGGIIVPSGVEYKLRARVLAVGEGRRLENGSVSPVALEEGWLVMLSPNVQTQHVQQHPDGGAVVLVHEDHITCVVETRMVAS